jgi:hypothetical protein
MTRSPCEWEVELATTRRRCTMAMVNWNHTGSSRRSGFKAELTKEVEYVLGRCRQVRRRPESEKIADGRRWKKRKKTML